MPRLREFKYDSWAEWAKSEVYEDRPMEIAVDTETSGIGFYDEPFCATLTWRGYDGDLKSAYISLEGEGACERGEYLTGILSLVPTWVFHNAKFDLQKLELIGVLPDRWEEEYRVEDTQFLAALLDENRRKALKFLAKEVLREETNEDEVLKKVRRKLGLKKEDGYYHIPREFIVPYALNDTEFTLRLFEALRPELPEDVEPAYERELELTRVLLEMEAAGICLDLDYLEQTASEYGARVIKGWQAIVDLTGKPELNPQSPIQLKSAFAELGAVLESTNVHCLTKLSETSTGMAGKLAAAILQYRSDKKMHTTYLTGLLAEQRNGRVHPWFNPVQARTGRMSSSAASQ